MVPKMSFPLEGLGRKALSLILLRSMVCLCKAEDGGDLFTRLSHTLECRKARGVRGKGERLSIEHGAWGKEQRVIASNKPHSA